MGRRTYERIFFLSFMRLFSKLASCNYIPQLLLSCSFFKKAAIIIAIRGQKNIALAVK